MCNNFKTYFMTQIPLPRCTCSRVMLFCTSEVLSFCCGISFCSFTRSHYIGWQGGTFGGRGVGCGVRDGLPGAHQLSQTRYSPRPPTGSCSCHLHWGTENRAPRLQLRETPQASVVFCFTMKIETLQKVSHLGCLT